MTPVFAARRRAEEFDSLVEGTSTSGLRDARYTDYLELVGSLREAPRVEARREFIADLRDSLMAAADKALAPATTISDRLTLAPRRTARERRIAVAVGGFAIVGATTSMAMAAQSALPGDVLYPLKRAIENVHTGFSVDDNQKGSTLLANASGRLDEVGELSRGGDANGDAAVIAETLDTFTQQASEASDLLMSDYASTGHESSITALRDFTAESMAALSDLEALVPDEARAALINAAQILIQIDGLAQSACPVCAGTGIPVVPPFAVNTSVDDLLASLAGSVTTVTGDDATSAHNGKTQNTGNNDGGSDPAIETGAHPPTTVAAPSQDTSGADQPGTEPIDPITEALTGDGTSQPSSDPSTPVLPDLGGILGGDGTVDDVTNPLLP